MECTERNLITRLWTSVWNFYNTSTDHACSDLLSWAFTSNLACEQALLFGQAKQASRERPSRRPRLLARSRETRFTRPNRRACSQATSNSSAIPNLWLSLVYLKFVRTGFFHSLITELQRPENIQPMILTYKSRWEERMMLLPRVAVGFHSPIHNSDKWVLPRRLDASVGI